MATGLIALTSRALWAADAPAANAAPPPNAAPAPAGRIVILGDSITSGYGLDDPAQAYPALLQEKITAAGLSYTVVNAGVSGDTTAGGLRRLDWTLSRPTAILIIALGGNDGLRGIAPQQTAENLTGIIQRARAKFPAIRIIVAGIEMPANLGPDFVTAFRAVFPQVATANAATLVPFLLEGVGGKPELNQPDLIHPTAEGQKRVAENVWAALQQMLTASAERP